MEILALAFRQQQPHQHSNVKILKFFNFELINLLVTFN